MSTYIHYTFLKRAVFDENAPRTNYRFSSVSPISAKRSTDMPRENTTTFIWASVHDTRDAALSKHYFRCPRIQCFHPG